MKYYNGATYQVLPLLSLSRVNSHVLKFHSHGKRIHCRLSPFPRRLFDETSHRQCLLIIQCDSSKINDDLIASARYRICDMRAKSKHNHITHVVFIIHLPVQVAHSTFVGFQGDPWISCHIDELRPRENAITLEVACGVKISQLFWGGQEINPSDSVGLKPTMLGNKKSPDEYTQCVRLNSCIQAAASHIQDSTLNKQRAIERVRLLIQVIPFEPIFPLGKYFILCGYSVYSLLFSEPETFYTVLVSHIYRMLCEREAIYQDDDWVLREAMNIYNLQTRGTFMNVLTRKLDDIIIPCLAEIIAFVDRSCNLSLLSTPFSQLWLKLFSSKRAEEALKYTPLAGNKKIHMIEEKFVCEFPFFWMIKELVDSLWDGAQNTRGI